MDLQPPETAKEVTRDEFFATVGKLDVHPHMQGDYPYLEVWKDRGGIVRGYSKDSKTYPKTSRYFVA